MTPIMPMREITRSCSPLVLPGMEGIDERGVGRGLGHGREDVAQVHLEQEDDNDDDERRFGEDALQENR